MEQCSQAEAALLVAHLQRLRTALLCMRRWQRSVQAHLPTALLCSILAQAFAHDPVAALPLL